MEEYNGKYFELLDCINGNFAEYPFQRLINGIRKLLEEFNEFHQYEFVLQIHELLTTGERVARVEKPDCGFHLIWGDYDFNATHRSGALDARTQFDFCYGGIDSYGTINNPQLTISNYVAEANIYIVEDKKNEFDVKSCKDFWNSLNEFLTDIINNNENYSLGYCVWGNKPSYIIEAEEKAKAKREAEAKSTPGSHISDSDFSFLQ